MGSSDDLVKLEKLLADLLKGIAKAGVISGGKARGFP
jgi:hypothetical protein